MQVSLPTIAGMDLAGEGKPIVYSTDRKVPVAAQWTVGSMEPGDMWKASLEIDKLEKGYYQIAVNAAMNGPGESPYVYDDAYVEGGCSWLTTAAASPMFSTSRCSPTRPPQCNPAHSRCAASTSRWRAPITSAERCRPAVKSRTRRTTSSPSRSWTRRPTGSTYPPRAPWCPSRTGSRATTIGGARSPKRCQPAGTCTSTVPRMRSSTSRGRCTRRRPTR